MEIDMTREEAIKELRGFIGQLTEGCQEVIKVLIPELAESEDERIMKYVLRACKETIEAGDRGLELSMDTTKKLYAYLEKQKEPTEELSTRLNGLMQEYVKSGKDEEEQEHRLKCYQLFWDALEDSEFFEREEQKPEWSDEDEIYLLDALWCVEQASKIASGENDMGACWSAERWLKSLKNRGNFPKSNTNSPWKPSKEQMWALDVALENFYHQDDRAALESLKKDLQKLM